MQMTGMKTCCKCKTELQFSYFGKRISSSDGFDSICRNCRSAEYIKRRFEILEKRKLQYGNNKSAILKYKKEYRIKNKSRIKIYNSAYYQTRRDKIISHQSAVQNEDIGEVSNKYVLKRIRSQLGVCDLNIIPPELIEIKRTIIKTKRLCRTLKNSEVN